MQFESGLGEHREIMTARTAVLDIAYHRAGPADGWPVVLLHGFPYDIHAYAEVVPILVSAGARLVVPYLRGFGPTRFRSSSTKRSGQQAALGRDVVDLLDGLELETALIAGFDWGGLSACVCAALWPERVTGLVAYAGYDIIDVERQRRSFAPSLERELWYQHLFQSERGRECLASDRRELARLLWQQWSPNWAFDDATFERTAASFDNPDFVDVVIHSYRFHFGSAPGDRALDPLERRLAKTPDITVPAVTLDGVDDPLKPGGTAHTSHHFTGRHEHRTVESGHALPYEAPQAFADAVLTVHGWAEEGRQQG